MAEGVRQIAQIHLPAKPVADLLADEVVPDVGLAADQDLIGQDVPGADADGAGGYGPAQPLFVLRPDFQIVLQDNGLPIQHEGQGGIALHRIQDAVHQPDQLAPELVFCQIPFSVPVDVANHICFDSHRSLLYYSYRQLFAACAKYLRFSWGTWKKWSQADMI